MQTWREASSLIIVTRASVRAMTASNNIIIKSTLMDQISSDPRHTLSNGTNINYPTINNGPIPTHHGIPSTIALTSTNPSNIDYRVMMVKRSGLSSFLASAYVFPGGRVELADFSARWWDLFKRFNLTEDDMSVFSQSISGPRPPIIRDPTILKNASNGAVQPDSFLPADIGFRISALRETFEETGVLLLTRPGDDADSYQPLSDRDNVNVDLSLWRDKVRKDASMFIDLCMETNLCPNLWSLHEWWNWLTPTSVGHKRCDTMFYVCFLEVQPKVVLDNEEVTTLKWCTPSGMLDEHSTADVFLAPPQVYELSRLCNFSEFDLLRQFAIERQSEGIERWLPVISTYQDGAIALLPGDEFYPEKPDYHGRRPVPDFPETLAEMAYKAKTLNRLEIRGPVCHARANAKPQCGHLLPKAHEQLAHAVLSPMI